ncbi:MAG TPA: branched-chain amino acid ABC transporter permease [Candidatus Scatomorpha merdipullorum]|uniref:Branched-chain amino acid ABC transporter permease n=1 Tax=Candidatus Scatomorpha merdipullorum TaxID=2840927 RepID=A0A9D1FEK9_9FIRM|nr:branched-chain amino acid ABC transporter permease [Candidatus Scatomorpha merdipullorum]
MKTSVKRGYLVNGAAVVLAYALFVVLAATLGQGGSFKLILAPSIWQCCYLILLAASLNLVLGFMGQLSLGHCGFMAIGAYTAALMSLAFQRAGVYDEKSGAVFIGILFLCIISAGLLAAVFGVLVGIPALRLKGDYLAIITLGFGLIIVNVINNLPFAGQNGLAEGSAAASLYATGLGFGSSDRVSYLWVGVGVTILCVTLMFMFIRSKYGRAVRAIRDDEIAAAASGINTGYYKVLTFAFSAFFAGVAGALYACCNASLSTVSFSFTNGSILNSTFVVVMVVLGGMGSLTGSVVSAVIMFLLNYQIANGAWVDALPGFVRGVFTYPMLVYALVLIVIIMFRPKGIFGAYEFSLLRTPRDAAGLFKRRGGKRSRPVGKEAAAQ